MGVPTTVTTAPVTGLPSAPRTVPDTANDGAGMRAKSRVVVAPSLTATPMAMVVRCPKKLAVTV
jgi:hypothetical protein